MNKKIQQQDNDSIDRTLNYVSLENKVIEKSLDSEKNFESIDNANQFGNRAEERFQRLKERLPSLIKAGEKASVFSETRATLRKLTGYNL